MSFVGYLFIDDTDLVQTGPTLTSTGQEVIPLMQAVLSLWEQGLQATGSALVPKKSFWYLIDFRWQGCKWRFVSYATKPGQLLMKDHTQQENPSDSYQQTLPNGHWGCT